VLKTDGVLFAGSSLIVRGDIGLRVGNFANAYRQRITSTLADAAGSQVFLQRFEFATSSNTFGYEITGTRGPAGGSGAWYDSRIRMQTDIDAFGAAGGYFDLGFRGSAAFWGLGDYSNGITIFWDQPNVRVSIPGARERLRYIHDSSS
jgi:hypothetical protein